MDLGLRGKVALVTAASRGMGRACAMGLASEGARVMMCARREESLRMAAEEIRAETGAEVEPMAADVTQAEDVTRLVARALEVFGSIDILVSNCGGPPRGGLWQMTDQHWYGAFEATLLSVVRLIREVVPSMRERGRGRIVAIQSVSVREPVEGLLLSNAVRPGVAGLVKTLSRELGKHNITINVVCPGRIKTDRFLEAASLSKLPLEEYVGRESADLPLRRIGTPEEFANVVLFLASDRASYVTGITLPVDGGMIRGIF